MKKNIIVITIMVLLLAIIAFQFQRSHRFKEQRIRDKQNIAAADSTIKTLINKNGNLTSEKATWLLSEKELKKQNIYLYDLVKQQDGNIISLNNVVFSLKQDATLLHDSIKYLHSVIGQAQHTSGNEWNLPWKLSYVWDDKNSDVFVGHTTLRIDTIKNMPIHLNTQLDSRESKIDLVFGEKVVDGKYNVYVTSKYPGLTASSMTGVFIDPNTNKDIKKLITKRHWFTGFSVGFGVTPGYDLLNNKTTVVVGPTFEYSIYQW